MYGPWLLRDAAVAAVAVAAATAAVMINFNGDRSQIES